MHELSVAEALFAACRDELAARGGGRIERARVAVGELSGVEPQLLRFAWEAVVADGPHAAATLEVDFTPLDQVCSSCGPVAERQPGSWLRTCPGCDAPLTLSGGGELDLIELEFEPATAEVAHR